MDVQTCIDSYMTISREVFRPRMRTRLVGRVIQSLAGSAAFDHRALEEAIKGIVANSLGDGDEMLLEEDPACKV